jgi:hypothetical protein
MFRLPSSVDPAALVAGLREHRVFTDCRGTTLRVSPGNLTTIDGVDRLLRGLRAVLTRSSTA